MIKKHKKIIITVSSIILLWLLITAIFTPILINSQENKFDESYKNHDSLAVQSNYFIEYASVKAFKKTKFDAYKDPHNQSLIGGIDYKEDGLDYHFTPVYKQVVGTPLLVDVYDKNGNRITFFAFNKKFNGIESQDKNSDKYKDKALKIYKQILKTAYDNRNKND